ncbi:polymerase [Guaroa virus]|uniref:RNA-directed RNA polymerase L n=1 Tax=Guaroa virus TaxID=80941 RepID=A0A0E3XUA4_9VIRU|nr:polymerase [Guaroa virus]
MDQVLYQQFVRRIENAKDATVAKDIDVDLLIARHDYFGRELCRSLGIQYRNDVPLIDIIIEIMPTIDPMSLEIPNITPDNYIVINGILVLIDYKVSVSDESTIMTLEKYRRCMEIVRDQVELEYEIAVIRINPVSRAITISSDLFKSQYPDLNVDINFQQFFDLKTYLFEKFRDDEEFMLKVSHGDFTLTAPWCYEDTNLEDHKEYLIFTDSLDQEYRELFLEALNFDAYGSERWNYMLHKVKDKTQAAYKDYTRKMSRDVFLMNGNYSKPSRDEIDKGWLEMVERVKEERILIADKNKQKPSVHMIWSPASNREIQGSTRKLVFLSNCLMGIKENTQLSDVMRSIGKSMDIDGKIGEYESICQNKKLIARSTIGQVKNKKITVDKVGNAMVLWEQQFILNNDHFKKNNRRDFLKSFLGIGGHKVFSDKTSVDIELNKPKMLDFTNKRIIEESIFFVNEIGDLLSRPSPIKLNEQMFDYFLEKVSSSNPETLAIFNKITNTNYWRCIMDISNLMKNILSVSQYNRHNTFRVAFCANDSLYAIVYPSADIKTKRATVVFQTITIHKNIKDVMDPGCLAATFKTIDGNYISLSKGIRLDKERCQRIIVSPGLFLISSILMYNNNGKLNLEDVLKFCFFTSLSITKSMLSLTEPSRYMIMNSLAVSSQVRQYISEKFSPYTKTLFSVYMTNLIKKGCESANDQSNKIELKNIFMSDYELTQKGVSEERQLQSIWFKGLVSLKEYLNQIYLPFYFNSKGLHEKHHVMIDLLKTVAEIERDQRESFTHLWSGDFLKQHVNLPIFLHSLSKNLILDTSRHNHLRNKVEDRNNFKRSITTISTFTSSKACIKVGDFADIKRKTKKQEIKDTENAQKKVFAANPLFFNDEAQNQKINHANYETIKQCVPDYTDVVSVKVFDRLYELIKTNELEEKPFINIAMDMMLKHTDHVFSFFNKGQKTFKDREIFVGQFETKMCMYVIERIAKERCKLNSDEMISEPGDNKLRLLEQKSESDIRFMIEKSRNTETPLPSLKLEINADMSKWSAQDMFFKYFWLIALDPILYPKEKKRILFFLCNYLNKKLVIPDELMCTLVDQKIVRENDLIHEMTNYLQTNSIQIRMNWLQGNFNYISSYIHTCAMLTFRDVVKETASILEGHANATSMVHSDDNQTSVIYFQDKLPKESLIEHTMKVFECVCLSFGCQANMKKTYLTHSIKEFVSLFNLHGEPFSVYGRFLLPSVGDCAYIGPYEDLASRLSAAITSIKHGCPPSYAWIAIACSHWITYSNYNMLPGQSNDPEAYLGIDREEIPIELGGLISAPLYMLSLCGIEAENILFLMKILKKLVPIELLKESVVNQVPHINKLPELSRSEEFRLKLLRYFVLDATISSESNFGETSDMRSRAILTPRKFTTLGSLRKLISYNDYRNSVDNNSIIENLKYMIDNPALLVTKGENYQDYIESIRYRYNSKRFKESLSIQNPAQLFIEQVLFSKKPVIDYNSVNEKYGPLLDSDIIDNADQIIGRLTYPEAFIKLYADTKQLPLLIDDLHIIYNHCICNDPLLVTCANSYNLAVQGVRVERSSNSACSMPEFRNMKLIHHSPALVLKAYSKGIESVPTANHEEITRDLYHLDNFLMESGILNKITTTLSSLTDDNFETYINRLRELTRLYQISYSYIKSTEHKVKIFILPKRAHTNLEFCSLIQGNLIEDKRWLTMHYLKPISSGNAKGNIVRSQNSEIGIACEAFRVLAFFTDSFISEEHRVSFIKKVMEEHTYKGVRLDYLYHLIKEPSQRLDYLPLLFKMGDVTQYDLNRFDAMMTNERISWNDWQTSRKLNVGSIDLTISGYLRSIRIVGIDNMLKMSEMSVPNFHPSTIHHAGFKLLNCKHGLKFEFMQEVILDDKINYYITYQKKRGNVYNYQVSSTTNILTRLKDFNERPRTTQRLIPVCPVILAVKETSYRLTMENITMLNMNNQSISRLYTFPEESCYIRRGHLSKMIFFDGPDLTIGNINMTRLMQTQEMLTLNLNNIKSLNLIPFCNIFSCNGEKNDEIVFSDTEIEILESEELESVPLFHYTYQKKHGKRLNYRDSIYESLDNSLKDFKRNFTFVGINFYSKENLGIISVLSTTIKQLGTNEWSTHIDNAIHIAMYRKGFDSVYHLFNFPKALYINSNPALGKLDWIKLNAFILNLSNEMEEPWLSMFNRFKEKASEFILGKSKEDTDTTSFVEMFKLDIGGDINDIED